LGNIGQSENTGQSGNIGQLGNIGQPQISSNPFGRNMGLPFGNEMSTGRNINCYRNQDIVKLPRLELKCFSWIT